MSDAINLKDSVLGSIVELGRAATDPEVNPCVVIGTRPASKLGVLLKDENGMSYEEQGLVSNVQKDKCDYKDCDNCPFYAPNAEEIHAKAEHLYENAVVLGETLDDMLDILVPPTKEGV